VRVGLWNQTIFNLSLLAYVVIPYLQMLIYVSFNVFRVCLVGEKF